MTKKHTHSDTGECSVVRDGERIAVLHLSAPLLTEHTVAGEAAMMVYAEMLTAGAGKHSREAFADALALLGSSISAREGDGNVDITLVSVDTHLRKTLMLLSAMLVEPAFPAKELSRVKRYIKNTLALARENARGRAYDAFINGVLGAEDRRRASDPEALAREVDRVTISDLRRLHKKFRTVPWTYTAGGSAESVDLLLSTARKFAPEEKEVVPTIVPLPVLTGRRVHLISIPNKQNIEFTLGGTLPLCIKDDEYSAFVFGMSVLALQGGFSGRLMSTVREKEGLTYSIYGKAEGVTKHEGGFWRIMTFFNPRDAVRGIESTLREVEKMHRHGITEDELRRFKEILKTRTALREDSLLGRVAELHNVRTCGLSKDEYENFKKDIERMTLRRANEAVRKHLDTKNLIVSGAGPVASIEKELTKFQT